MNKPNTLKNDELSYCSQAIFDLIFDDIKGTVYVSGDPKFFAEVISMLESFLQPLTDLKDIEILPKPHFSKANNSWQLKAFNNLALQHLPNLPFYIQKAFELPQDIRFSERVEFFKEYCKSNPSIFDGRVVEFCKDPINKCSSREDYMVLRDTVNQFIDHLRYQLLRTVRLKTIAARSDAVNKNWQLTNTYIKKTFKRCPTQDVIMFDLGYNDGKSVGEKESGKHIARFNKNKKRKELFQEVNDFVIKPDYGKGKEYHGHLMLKTDWPTKLLISGQRRRTVKAMSGFTTQKRGITSTIGCRKSGKLIARIMSCWIGYLCCWNTGAKRINLYYHPGRLENTIVTVGRTANAY
jgi:hypothetical protein